MNKLKCKYCKNIFKSKVILKHHIKTAKYCIKIQRKLGLKVNNIFHICQYCKKNFTQKIDLQRHELSCLPKREFLLLLEKDKEIEAYKSQINELRKQVEKYESHIKELEARLENIAIKAVERPTTTYQDNRRSNINQIINNLQPITEEHLREQAQYLTFDHIQRGIPGYVEYALEYPLKDRIICVDFSRRKIKYKDTDENVITDPEMTKLSQKLFSAIGERNKALILHYLDQMSKKVFGNIDDEKSEGDSLEEDKILKESRRIDNYKTGVFKGSKGDLTDFQKDFVKAVCTKVSSS